jgi:osmotically-inducible protein OsmY
MYFFLLLRKADEMGINFWLRLLALGLCVSLSLLSSYYFLVVNRAAATTPLPATLPLPNTEKRQADAALSARVRSALTQAKRLHGHSISVETKGGFITLTGEVPSEIDKDLAGNLTQGVPGVQEVKNQLRVTPSLKRPSEPTPQVNTPLPIEDLEMEANLRETLQASAELRPQTITIKVSHRVVTITGRVASEPQKRRVEQLIRHAPKVSRVINQLRVGS